MSDWVRVADPSAVADASTSDSSGDTFFVDDHEVAVFRVDGKLRAIEGKCPHMGASLAGGKLQGNCVACPWHGWVFDTADGSSPTHPNQSVGVLCVKEDKEGVWIDRDSIPQPEPKTTDDDGVHRYLIRYASPGWVGVFGTIHEMNCPRGSRVVVQTNRGKELGEVLAGPTETAAQAGDSKPTGEVLRVATEEELSFHREQSVAVLDKLIETAQSRLDAESVEAQVIDAELLLDRRKAVLYYLGEASPVLTDLRELLSQSARLEAVEWATLIEPTGGCGAEGCGGGGCQTHE
jgi:nitrite reductase (NADH) small subunit